MRKKENKITDNKDSLSAYTKNQASSQTSDYGNGFNSINVGCQNTESQIQGDENSVALTAQMTFPEVRLVKEKPIPPPKGCVQGSTSNVDIQQIDYIDYFE
jgi:hypothetical protein